MLTNTIRTQYQTCSRTCVTRIQDPGSCNRILDPGSWILDPGTWTLDSGSWILDPGSRTLLPITCSRTLFTNKCSRTPSEQRVHEQANTVQVSPNCNMTPSRDPTQNSTYCIYEVQEKTQSIYMQPGGCKKLHLHAAAWLHEDIYSHQVPSTRCKVPGTRCLARYLVQ